MTPAAASTLAFVFQGICFTMPVLGGWLADSKGGKFSVILFSAVIYLLGTLLLPLGSIERNGNNKEKSQWAANNVTTNLTFMQAVYITGLFLVACGTGGIKANVSPFGAEQISNRGPAAIEAFFRWFYWFINVGALVSYTVVVYIQQNISFFYGNLVPACTIILSLIVFLSGKQAYVLHSPTKSALTKILSIIKEAIKKYTRPSLSSSFVKHWLDRAKMCFGGSYSSEEVEDVKNVFRLLPIFGTFVVYWTIYAQMFTSMMYQGENMNIKIAGIDFPIASLSVVAILGLLIFVPVMDKFIYPLLARCGIRPSQLQRIGFGMIIMTAAMACAGRLELYRVKECCMLQTRNGDVNATEVSNITILYQVPQYALIGLSEVFASVTGLELAFTEAPKSLQGVIMGVFLLTTGLGFFIGAALVAIVNEVSEAFSGEEGKWYPDKKYVNQSPPHLAYYFFLLAGLMFLNFIVFIFVAVSFKKKKETASRATMSERVMNNGEARSLILESEQPDSSVWSSDQFSSNSAP